MKIVHAADIHLDSPLVGLERYEGAPLEALRGATRAALDNLVALCLEQDARLLILAGDLYDGNWRDFNSGLHFARQMARLTREGMQVVLIRGNHDAVSQITRRLRLPDGVRELSSDKPQTVILEALGVAVHGQSYHQREVQDDLSAAYPAATPGALNIGVLHTALNGRPGHAVYAPCSPAGLATLGYQYWALGHVHQHEVVSSDPWIVFSGCLQGRHVREAGQKGAVLIEAEGDEVLTVEHRPLDVVRWGVCKVAASNLRSADEVVEAAREAVALEVERAEGRPMAVRLQIQGRCGAHAALASDPERWSNEIRAGVTELGLEVWLEKIDVQTEGHLDLDHLAQGQSPVSALVRDLRELWSSPTERAALTAALTELASKLPQEYFELEGALDVRSPDRLDDVWPRVEALLLPELLGRLGKDDR